LDRVRLAAEFSLHLEQLGDRRGPVLLQFPPTREADTALLSTILEAMAGQIAVEFRHQSWLRHDVYDVLRRRGAALVVTDQEKWLQAPRLELSSFAYFRLRRDYDDQGLERWAEVVRSELAQREEVHVYFKHEPQAAARAVALKALAGVRS
jgi:uncharacterized protein YecE (DUF72 family)